MATKTTNYQFTKPEEDDFYNIEEANENWDVVDQELKKLEEEKANVSGGDISNTVIHALDSQEEEFPIPAAGDTVRGFSGKIKKFFEDFRAFKDGVITVGRLVNNGLTTKEGFALDARYGKTLADGFAQLSNDSKNYFHRHDIESTSIKTRLLSLHRIQGVECGYFFVSSSVSDAPAGMTNGGEVVFLMDKSATVNIEVLFLRSGIIKHGYVNASTESLIWV